MTVLEEVWFARSYGFSRWIVEMDVANVVRAIKDLILRSMEANVIEDICDFCNIEVVVMFFTVFRLGTLWSTPLLSMHFVGLTLLFGLMYCLSFRLSC